MIMPKQQNGSAKRFLAYHNVLILHKSEKQTVKDQLGLRFLTPLPILVLKE